VARVDGVKENTIEALTEHLQATGFSVKSFPIPNSRLGLFFASRNEEAASRERAVTEKAA
jgi:hypothetical protein